MRKRISLLLVLLLALPVVGATAESDEGLTVVSSPEAHFSTRVDFECATEYRQGDGMYFKLADDLMPYVLVSVDVGDDRVTDPAAYMNQVLVPELQAKNEANGAMASTVHGDGVINGRPSPVLEFQYYNSDGLKIYFVAVFDVLEDYTAYYRARYYREEDMAMTLAAMETIAANLQPDPYYYTGGTPQPASTPQRSAAAETRSFAVTDIAQGGMVVGRCTAPADWQVIGQAVACTTAQSISNPWLLYIRASAPGGARMTYASARDYFEILRWDGGQQHQDGAYSPLLHTTLLRCMDAPTFCDYCASTLAPAGVSLTLVEDNQFPELQSLLRQREQEAFNLANAPLTTVQTRSVDGVEFSLCSRRYALELDGVPCYLCVTTGIEAIQMTSAFSGIYTTMTNSFINWEAPFTYTLLCPADSWESAGAAFAAFVGNTGASDEFNKANERLSNELWSIVNGRNDLSSGSAYSEDVLRGETAFGDDYDEDRYTDYIFDQDDYTLSDGSHVKVSTAYDYVYQGNDGTVYYSDSALAQPGGSIRLYPNQ